MNTSNGVNNSNVVPRKINNQNIQVYVRLRPLNARERCIRSAEVIEVVSPREVVTRHTVESKLTKKFTFDRTFGQDSRQVDVYSNVVAPLIEEVLAGYNCTVFAYGQTGTGKTHTMIGTECAELKSSWEDDSEIGIIPRALSHLFDELRLMELEFSMRISYLELYNEELCDLLSTDDSTKIRIFDDSTKKGSVIIQGLEEIPVHSKDDVYKLLEKGKERRKTATTLMNAQSSRSHTVFSILVHIRENGIDGEEMLKIGKLNLVDLAGSENVTKAGNEKGIRVRETVNINQSLLTLGRVITALVERTPHIPYRESKLTRLLQESLGGRTKTSIIATISPGHKDIEETLSTLEYAHRAKNIQNKPEVNQKLTKKTVIKEYTEEIDKLKRDLIAARDKNGIYLPEETYMEITVKMDSQNRELNEKMLLLKALKDELVNKERVFNEVSLNLVERTEELKRKEQNLLHTKGELQHTKKILHSTKRRYKEKKILLESHVKTEEQLTTQAGQILQAADMAANDTQQLHSTIERRQDVDKKIQTACERFAERMHDNFEQMDENLDQLQDKHKSWSKMIIDDLAKSATVQTKLLRDADQRIKCLHDLCSKSLHNNISITEKYAGKLNHSVDDSKTKFEQLLNELKTNELAMKQQIEESLLEVQHGNEQHKLSMQRMRELIVSALHENSAQIDEHTAQLQQQIATTRETIEKDVRELAQLQQVTELQNDLAERERLAIEKFVSQMSALREERSTSVRTMATSIAELRAGNQKSTKELTESAEFARSFYLKRRLENATAQEQCEAEATAFAAGVDKSTANCTAMQTQLDHLYVESGHCVGLMQANGHELHNSVAHITEEHHSEVKRLRMQDEENVAAACQAIQKGLQDECRTLKGNITVGMEFTHSLESQMRDYAKTYKEQVGHCSNDVDKFKQSELQTYMPTGATPSKRDFKYPRVLAATSPHNQIVQRFRQENDWSDLDTTATIDEGSEVNEEDEEDDGHEADNSVQYISDTETILNSTPLEEGTRQSNSRKTNSAKSSSGRGSNPNGSQNLPLSARNSPQPLSNTPRKAATATPDFAKINKENLA